MWQNDRYIYLHMFDRELRNSLGAGVSFSDNQAMDIISTALFMSYMPLYVSFSHMYESLNDFPYTIQFAFECEKNGLLYMLTNMRNIDEFMSSRRSLYQFDKNRYSNYFSVIDYFWPTDTIILHDDTTSILRNSVLQSIIGEKGFSAEVEEALSCQLIKNKTDAITFNFFKNVIDRSYSSLSIDEYQYKKAVYNIRTIISRQYTKRYLGVYNGTIISGISGFNLYDGLAYDSFLTNYKLYKYLLSPLLNHVIDKTMLLEIRISNKSQVIIRLLQWIIIGLDKISKSNVDVACSYLNHLNLIQQFIDVDNYIEQLIRIFNIVFKECEKQGGLEKMQTKIMIVVATQLELDMLIKKIKTEASVAASIGMLSYFSTIIGNNLINIIKCQMGQSGVGGSILTVENAIKELHPDFVIMSGIAWGANKEKQSIGDLLITTQVWDYDLEKIKSDGTTISRGAITPASPRLVQMLETLSVTINEYSTYFGVVASGSKLLDNQEFVTKLLLEQPEIIGGDMESAGVAAVCNRNNIDWVVVKGICDWGFDKNINKNEYQIKAANNSSDIILRLMQQMTITI